MKTSTLLLTATGAILAGVATYLIVKRTTSNSEDNFFDRLGEDVPQSHIRNVMHRAKTKAIQSSEG